MHSLTTAKLLCLALLQGVCGQECGTMGGSFGVNDTGGVITVRGLVDGTETAEDRPCYWLFEPPLPHYMVVLRIQNVTGNGPEVSVDDRNRGGKQCIFGSGTCLDKYVYRKQTYHGECIGAKWWRPFGKCMIDQEEETWKVCRPCILETNEFSTDLRARKTYCYNNCNQDIHHARDCQQIKRNVDSVLRYEQSNSPEYFEIFYKIIPCQNSTTGVMSSSPTEMNPESKVQTTTVTPLNYRKTTGNRQLTSATSGELSNVLSSKTIVSIIVPVLVVVVFILIVGLVTAFIIRKRKTAEKDQKNKKEDVENVLYVAFQGSDDDKLEVENVLYETT